MFENIEYQESHSYFQELTETGFIIELVIMIICGNTASICTLKG